MNMCIEESKRRIAEYEALIAKERESIIAEAMCGKMEIDVRQLLNFGENFSKLSAEKIRIIKHLLQHGRVEATLADFSFTIGSKHPSNVLRSIASLECSGLVEVERVQKERTFPMTAISMADNWIEIMLTSDK